MVSILLISHFYLNILFASPSFLSFEDVERLFNIINGLFFLFFSYSKYIFALILIILGLETLLKFRGIYRHERVVGKIKDIKNKDWTEEMKKTYVIVGLIYVFMGFGIVFNFLTYILIWILEPLPDRFIFEFLTASNVLDPKYLSRLSDINSHTINPYERTFYYLLALISFLGILQIMVGIYFIIKQGNVIKNPTRIFFMIMGGIVEGILAGFTTSLLFFI